MKKYLLILLMISISGIGSFLLLNRAWRNTAKDEPLPGEISVNEYELARKAYELRYGRTADRVDVFSWLAEWFQSRNRLSDAIVCFAEIPTAHPVYGRMARYQQGRALLSLHRALEAETQFDELIRLEESAPTIESRYLVDARQRLRHIYEVELQFEKRHQLLRGVIERGEEDPFELVVFCFPSLPRWNGPDAVQRLEQFHRMNSTEPVLNVALGRYRLGEGKLGEAREILEAVVRERPDDLSALAALAACLREADQPEELSRCMEALPPQSPRDPWLLLIQRGLHANENGHPEMAVVALEQLLAQDRTCAEAWTGLARATLLLDDLPRRKQALSMAAGLGRIQNHLGKVIRQPDHADSYLDVADLCAEISLNREGWYLARYAHKLAPQSPRVLSMIELFQNRLSAAKEVVP